MYTTSLLVLEYHRVLNSRKSLFKSIFLVWMSSHWILNGAIFFHQNGYINLESCLMDLKKPRCDRNGMNITSKNAQRYQDFTYCKLMIVKCLCILLGWYRWLYLGQGRNVIDVWIYTSTSWCSLLHMPCAQMEFLLQHVHSNWVSNLRSFKVTFLHFSI